MPIQARAEPASLQVAPLAERIEACMQVLSGADILSVAPGIPQPPRLISDATAHRVTSVVGAYEVFVSFLDVKEDHQDICSIAVDHELPDHGPAVLDILKEALLFKGFVEEPFLDDHPLFRSSHLGLSVTAFPNIHNHYLPGEVLPHIMLQTESLSSQIWDTHPPNRQTRALGEVCGPVELECEAGFASHHLDDKTPGARGLALAPARTAGSAAWIF